MFGVIQEVSLCLKLFTLHCKHKCTHLHLIHSSDFHGDVCYVLLPGFGKYKGERDNDLDAKQCCLREENE